MNKLFKKICVPLMLVNNNIYTFISGILISLSTGMFTTLCLEKSTFSSTWYLYVSVILYSISGAICIYIATKISSYQNYILANKIVTTKEKHEIVEDFETPKQKTWFMFFALLFLSLVGGTGFLLLNYFK